MTKVVYNRCFGGFSLSHKAIMRYAQIKGFDIYPVKDGSITHYFYENPNGRSASKMCSDGVRDLYDRYIERHDPALVQVVEELGEDANGMCAELRITEIEGKVYRIDEYDGRESVEEPGLSGYSWVQV